jgi:hypothetical protein
MSEIKKKSYLFVGGFSTLHGMHYLYVYLLSILKIYLRFLIKTNLYHSNNSNEFSMSNQL